MLCPLLPGLRLVGMAVSPNGGHYLILTVGSHSRVYLGPDDATVARHTQMLEAALKASAASLGQTQRQGGDWVSWAWEAMLDELSTALVGKFLK